MTPINRYTKFILTIIAVALVVIASRLLVVSAPAGAANIWDRAAVPTRGIRATSRAGGRLEPIPVAERATICRSRCWLQTLLRTPFR